MQVLRTYLAVYLVSVATLSYEIGLTRIFSMAQGYHFSFMVISIALMGIGAGGAVLMVLIPAVEEYNPRRLSSLSSLLSIAAIVSYMAANLILFDPVKASWSKAEFSKILIQYLILSIPFVLSGMIISEAIRSMSVKVHRIYFSDLAGAASGCILILLILSKTGGEWVIIVSATIALISSIIFSNPERTSRAVLQAVAAVLLAVVLFGPAGLIEIKISPYRELPSVLNYPGGRTIGTLYSASGRMDIVDSPAVRAAPGVSLNYRRPLPPQLGFTINGGGLSTVTSRTGDLSFLTHLPSALPYRLKKNAWVFVDGVGGGMEVLSALANGASGVRGADTSGVVISAMNGPLSDFSGGLYSEVPISHGYGRNFLKRLGMKFDVIQLPRTGTLGSASSGIRGLQEDYSLTVEAFGVYLDHLNVDGFVSVSLYLLPPPRAELKLLATAVKALSDRGVKKPAERVMAIRSWGVVTLVVKNGAVNDKDIEKLKAFSESEGFDMVWYPGMERTEANLHNRFSGPVYHDLFTKLLDAVKMEDFMDGYIFDVRPSTDDRPFFGQTFKLSRMRETFESVGRKWGILIEGGYLLPWVLLQAAAGSLILIFTPLLFSEKKKNPPKALFYTGAYFAAIGVGFMFVEISLIQKLIPVLGEPVYAISAVLFSILISTGAGSYLSGRFEIVERSSAYALLIVPALVIIYLFALVPVTNAMVNVTIATRYFLTFVFFLPLGVAMGMPFPAGMILLGRSCSRLIPWAWCVNGSTSVASSVLVMMVALAWGFSTALIIAACAYICAWAALKGLFKTV